MGGFLDKTKGHDGVRTKGRGRSGGVTARARPSRSKDDTYKHGPRKCAQGSAGGRGIILDPLCGELDHRTCRVVLLHGRN